MAQPDHISSTSTSPSQDMNRQIAKVLNSLDRLPSEVAASCRGFSDGIMSIINNQVASNDEQIAQKDAQIANRDELVAGQVALIANQVEWIASKDKRIAVQVELNAQSDQHKAKLDALIATKDEMLAQGDQMIAAKDQLCQGPNDGVSGYRDCRVESTISSSKETIGF
ncbi:hypothetical protein BT63DRAFT_428680 [Microthyrium microscopicum]|uniref:Uncharacterized protein n=1 Tax=Microthyrium microscopicum TaxID=703497 RepID=A0A6A6U397_9PEZI|nr:hypothetical protein BT63DRAFT_428680 [Microthyrium microscopicum]